MNLKCILPALCASLFVSVAQTNASPILLINAESGEVLYENEATRSWHPASLTKLMTAYLVFEALSEQKLNPLTFLTVSKNATAQKPSKLGFAVGSKITVEAALHALITKSANDIAVVLAEGASGTVPAFVADMNKKAQEFGMSGTYFVNPNGMPAADQVTTARDMAILAQKVLQNYPQYESFFRVAGLQIGNKTTRSFNALIGRYEGASGMKTGFICDSGFNLVGSAYKNGQHLIAVVLGETTGVKRAEKAAELFDLYGRSTGSEIRVSQLQNEHNLPVSMRNEVCGKERQQIASESDEFVDNSGNFDANNITSNFFMTQQASSRIAPKPATIRAVKITLEKQNLKAKIHQIIAYIDHGNGRPVIPQQKQPAQPSIKNVTTSKPVKFMPAHPEQKGIIPAPKPVKIPADKVLKRLEPAE